MCCLAWTDATCSGITVERLFSQHCSGDKFRHDEAIRERFGHHENNVVINLESQVTVSSASNAAHLSQASANESAPDCHSQPLTSSDEDSHPQSAPSPELGLQTMGAELNDPQALDFEMTESIDGPESLQDLDPAGFQDSQDSTISELALETRLQAFRTVLNNARGKVGGEIGLLSTTDHHSELEAELSYAVPKRRVLSRGRPADQP
jgi:hypothetical protein